MSLIGSIVSTVTESGFAKTVKKTAKKIKNVASQVLDGLTGKEGIISKAYNKVKSFGTMALGKILPGYGDDVIQPLQAAASSTRAAGGTGFVTAVSSTLNNATAVSGTEPAGITEWFSNGFTQVGGKIKEGVSNVYDSTMEFFGLKPEQQKKIQDPGKWITDKSVERFNATTPTSEFNPWVVGEDIYDTSSKRGVMDYIGAPTYPLSTENQPLNLQYEAAKTAGMDANMLETARNLNVRPTDPLLSEVQSKGLVGSGVGIAEQDPHALKSLSSSGGIMDAVNKYGPLLAEGLVAGLAGQGGGAAAGGGSAPRNVGVQNRSGIGGKGAAGGDFLSEAQRAFLEKQRRTIEAMG